MVIDTHCHISKNDYNNIDEVINNMESNIMITSGVDLETSLEVMELCNKYDNIYGAIGIHPSEIHKYDDEALKIIEENIMKDKIVAIGEIGLDYHYGKENKAKQIEIFEKQITLAQKYNKPIIVHSRDAANDTLNILKKYNNIKIVMHCFSYSIEVAKELIKMGAKLGIGGVLTFNNSTKLKNVVSEIDLDNILLETDSPYLAPVPLRGSKNEPINIKYVVKEIAKIKGISEIEVENITTLNAIKEFDLNLKK